MPPPRLVKALGFLDTSRGRIIPAFVYTGLIPLATLALYYAGGIFEASFLTALFLALLLVGALLALGVYYSDPKNAGDDAGHTTEQRQERLRIRTIAWGMLAVDAALGFLTLLRMFPGTASLLVPSNLFSVTEITVLVLTLGILALLSRYTTVASQFHGATVAAEVRTLRQEISAEVVPRLDSLIRISSELVGGIAAGRARAAAEDQARAHFVGVSLRTAKTGLLTNGVFLDITNGPSPIAAGSAKVYEPLVGGGSTSGTLLAQVAQLGSIGADSTRGWSLFDVGRVRPEAILSVVADVNHPDGYTQSVTGKFRLKKRGLLTFWMERVA